MREIVHRVDAPLIPGIVMGNVRDTVKDRIPHIDIRRRHIDLCAQRVSSVLVFPLFHLLKEAQVLFHRTLPVRIILARLGQRPAVLAHLLRRKLRNIRFAFFDQPDSGIVHSVKIIRREIQMLAPVGTEPFDVLQNRIDELGLFLGRIRIIEPHVEGTVVLFGNPVIQQDRLRVSDVQIAIRLRRKPCTDRVVVSFF